MSGRMLLTEEEEALVARYFITVHRYRFPFTTCKNRVKSLIRELLKTDGRDKRIRRNGPGDSWFKGFFKRHPNLKQKAASDDDGSGLTQADAIVVNHLLTLLGPKKPKQNPKKGSDDEENFGKWTSTEDEEDLDTDEEAEDGEIKPDCCLDVVLPTSVLEACQSLPSGQSLELEGLGGKEGDLDGSETAGQVEVLVEKESTSLTLKFTMFAASSMESICKRKLYDHWMCEITSVSSPDENSVDQALTTTQDIQRDNRESVMCDETERDDEEEDSMDGDDDNSFFYFDDSDVSAGDLEKSAEVTSDASEGNPPHARNSMWTAAESETTPNIPTQNDVQQAGEDAGGTIVHAEVPNLCSTEELATQPTTGTERPESEPSGSKRKRPTPKEPPKEHACPQCGKVFPFLSRLLKHVNGHYGIKQRRYTKNKAMQGTEISSDPTVSDESVDTTSQEPAVSSKPDKSYCCERCGETFTDRIAFRNHRNRHTYTKKIYNRTAEKKQYACNTCGKECRGPRDLISHNRVHTGEKPFVCSVCGRRFASKQACMIHMPLHTGERPFVCSFCGKGFILKHDLAAHTRTHTGERPFACDVCGKAFYQRSTLKGHMRTHSTERPFACAYCGKGFKYRAVRDTHELKHTGKVAYTCDLCGKGFRHPGSFYLHKRIHTGEKPHSCSICGKRFNNKAHVARHERIHTGEKPYQCPQCGDSFAQNECLKRHMNKHASGNTQRPSLVTCV